jgi:hypothetical protein
MAAQLQAGSKLLTIHPGQLIPCDIPATFTLWPYRAAASSIQHGRLPLERYSRLILEEGP